MRILIPTNEKNMEDGVCPSFGRAPYFMVYNTETHQKMFVDNPGASSNGGAGIVAAQQVIDLEVQAVGTPQLGKNAYDLLCEGDIEVFETVDENVKDMIDAMTKGQLKPLIEVHAGFHMHGAL